MVGNKYGGYHQRYSARTFLTLLPSCKVTDVSQIMMIRSVQISIHRALYSTSTMDLHVFK